MKQSEVSKRLGRRVNALRVARGMTQETLAERCDITSKSISEIERGLVNVPILTLAKLADGIGATISELTLGIEGRLPDVAREGTAIYAGRSRSEQAVIAKLLAVIDELVREARRG